MALDLKRAKSYQRKKYFGELSHLGLQTAILTFLILSGFTFLLKQWAVMQSGNFYIQASVYYGLFFLIFLVSDFPLTLYSGFFLEHAYALSNQSFGAWLVDFLKRTLLSFMISWPILLGLFFLIRRFLFHWWVWAWAGFALIGYVLGQLFPILIVPLFYRYSRVENDSLRERIFKLVGRFGLPLENVYSLNLSRTTKKANAMFAGLGKTKRLVLADTLIQNFSPEEIESVVAHELGHFKHHDIWRHLGFSCAVSFVFFASAFYLLRALSPQLGYEGAQDLAAFPLLYLIFFLFGTLLTPLNNAYSRWREREADRFALQTTGPAGFIPAMEKLAQLNLADPNPHPIVVWWFYTHPPIEKRIQMARSFKVLLLFFLFLLPMTIIGYGEPKPKESEREQAIKDLENRSRTEMMSFFLGKPKGADNLNVSLGIDLYNQAVEFFRKREYDLAKQALEDAISKDPKNPFAYELLGDIFYLEQKLDDASKNYEAAYRIKARQDLKEKILKIQKEKKIETGLATDHEEHFIIKYKGEEQGIEGFALRELLRSTYRSVGQDLGYFFRQKVVVLLYDESEFRQLQDVPHWSSGMYDGKIRLPAYQQGFTQKEIEKVMRHELTHAFLAEISRGLCPAWLNEGLAEYEESKVERPDPKVFDAAVRTNTLFPISEFISKDRIVEIRDPLEAQLFYSEAYELVKYLVERHGMFKAKKMLELFGEGKDSFEAIQEVYKMSPLELERRWKENF